MKGPVCEECTRSGVLCGECGRRLKSGEIGEEDVKLALVLDKLERKGMVRGASFCRAYLVDNLVVITTTGRVGALVGKGGRVVRLLSQELNKKVRIIGIGDVKTALADLVAPARIQGINIVYKPEGEETKVVISEKDKYKLIAPRATLEKAANLLSDKAVVLEFG